ncbi:two component transcriptional regulator, LuxR family [Treponema primitia ZAS-2]|uniref:Two component transcriptional regulator, LuxR family n=1 Tax=Treponema primitia (strain ATCC BAA-887 / DSM 12427 / ZAS-2) TaxID=545694 RepID=F5YL67_TREPZ|nr:response regulator transcription factor [Treponema primitia]AEF86356.1 two component transcriptional regulator, LuxR family [Treponema primitia ZAS-2]
MNTLVLIDDHTMMRRGLASYFTQTGRWQVLGEAGSQEEALALFETLSPGPLPGIILLDIDLHGSWGLDLIPRLRNYYEQKPPALIYSVYEDYAHVKAAIRAEAAGYVCKSQGEAELEMAMDAVLQGRIFFAPHLIVKMDAVSDILLCLTKRERQIFGMVQRSYSNRQIAEELVVSVRTIENNLSIIYDKTGVPGRKELEKL